MNNSADFVIDNGVFIKYNGTAVKIIIPDGVTKIDKNAFAWNKYVRKIVIPKGVTVIDEHAFHGCANLREVIIPDSVTHIGKSAFFSCSNLHCISIPASVTHIEDNVFYRCLRITDLIIPDGVTQIGESAFSNCTHLHKIHIPDSVTSIGSSAFSDCGMLSSVVLPEGITAIEPYTFYGCRMLESINIPERVTSIGNSAFYDCTKLQSLTLPDSITRIGDAAFFACSKLQSINIPDSLTDIGPEAFGGCCGLTDDTGFFILRNTLFHYNGQETNITIPEETEIIDASAFRAQQNLQSITIGSKVKLIGKEAFLACSNLKSITIPGNVKVIGDAAFRACNNLTSVRISEGVTSIGAGVFRNCYELQYVSIPESVTSIKDSVFDGCTKLRFVSIPSRLFNDVKKHLPNTGILLKDGDNCHFYAYGQKGDSDNYSDFIIKNNWIAYESELLNNGPKYKYNLISRLIGILGCVAENADRNNNFGDEFFEFLIKNVRKLISIADEAGCPEIVKLMIDTGVINQDNIKAVKKLLSASHDERISAFSSIEVKKTEAKTETAPENNNPLSKKYALLLKEMQADKIIREMKLKGSAMPEVILKDGTPAPDELFLFILASYGKQYKCDPEVIPEADEAAELLSYDSLCNAMEEISDNLNAVYYPALIPLLCRFGNPAQIKLMTGSLRTWHDWHTYGAKGRRACDGLNKFLVLSNTRVAVIYLEKHDMIENFAKIRGISVEEVYEKYLFDFEFDENGIRTFDTGSALIDVSINDSLKLQIINRNTGKSIRSIPKKGADPDKYQFAADELDDMKKSLSNAVKIKQKQLFADYIEAAEFPAEKWKSSYLKNSFLNHIARILVWTQDEKTFLLTENGMISSDTSPYALSDSPIKIAHPMEMKKEEITAWQKYFTSHGLKQPFEQIWENCIDEKDFRSDRYKDCYIPRVFLKNQEKRGFTDYWNLNISGFSVQAEMSQTNYNEIEITFIEPITWNRRTNMVIAFLDRLTVYGRIVKDDVSVRVFLPSFTLAQITDFIQLAAKNNATKVTAMLLEYKNENFSDFDPLDEFTLD